MTARYHLDGRVAVAPGGTEGIRWLMPDAAAYITGAVAPCDGGALLTRARLSPSRL